MCVDDTMRRVVWIEAALKAWVFSLGEVHPLTNLVHHKAWTETKLVNTRA